MTRADYIKAYSKAHQKNGRITRKTLRELQKVFADAADLTSAQVLKTTAAGLSDLTSSAWASIEAQLKIGADLISQATEDTVPLMITKSYGNYLDIDTKYIMDAVNASSATGITAAGVRNIGVGVNLQLLQIQAERIWASGYTFSESVWNLLDPDTGLPIGVNGDYQYRIKNLILTGQAQGRDIVDIAQDIQVYVAKGKTAVFKPGRYGRLIPGTARFKRRISQLVDWRVQRILRSEENASLQEAGKLEGILNPGSDDTWDWVKTPGNPIDEDGSRNASGLRCIDLDRNSPYTEDEIPGYQHPNDSCSVRPNLKPQKEFVSELNDWVPGDGSSIDSWYEDIYLRGQK